MKKVYLLSIMGMLAAGLVGCGMGGGGSGLLRESSQLPGTQGSSSRGPQAKVTRVAEKAPSPDSGQLSISSQPKGAKVSLNGSDTDQVTPQVFQSLQVGEISVSLEAPGYHEWRESVTIEEGRTTKVTVKLSKLSPGALKVIVRREGRREPGAVVKLAPSDQEKKTDRDGICIFKRLIPGVYSVAVCKMVSGESCAGTATKIQVSSGKMVKAKISLAPEPAPSETSQESK